LLLQLASSIFQLPTRTRISSLQVEIASDAMTPEDHIEWVWGKLPELVFRTLHNIAALNSSVKNKRSKLEKIVNQ